MIHDPGLNMLWPLIRLIQFRKGFQNSEIFIFFFPLAESSKMIPDMNREHVL